MIAVMRKTLLNVAVSVAPLPMGSPSICDKNTARQNWAYWQSPVNMQTAHLQIPEDAAHPFQDDAAESGMSDPN
jgi:hypothetical protein